MSGVGWAQGIQKWPQGGWWILQSLRPGSNSALEMAESSFLCASSDGMLWNLARCTNEGEWITDNIWQKKAEMPATQTSETGSCISTNTYSWSTVTELKTQQRRKVSLRERSLDTGEEALGLTQQTSLLP